MTKFNSGAMIYSDTFVLIYYKGGEKMPDAVTVFIATVIANIVSSLILDLLHTALQKWHQG